MDLAKAKTQSKWRVEDYLRRNYNLYTFLGVHPSTGQEEVNRRLRVFVRPAHPDGGGNLSVS